MGERVLGVDEVGGSNPPASTKFVARCSYLVRKASRKKKRGDSKPTRGKGHLMSLAINTTTPEGIVLAADSRQSYRNRKGMARIGSDNASKLFQLNRRIGAAVTGLAFLPENGVRKNISKFIEEFKRETDVEKLNVKEAAEKLHYLFNKKYNWQKQLDKLPEKIKNDLQRKNCEIL